MAYDVDRKLIEEIAQKYTEVLMDEMKISQVYLYGSYVKGSNNQDSDIDIAVVGDVFTGDKVEDTLKLMKLRRKVDNRIEPHPFKNDEFDISNPFVNEIITTGIRII